MTTAPGRSVRRWLAAHDPGLLATKRAVRAAVVVPVVFSVTLALFDNGQSPFFAAFGSFGFLLLVDFQGSPRARLRAYVTLFVVGTLLITVGTLLSTHPVVAPLSMGVVGFAILFAGIVGPQVARAATGALLMYVLPVAVPGPPAAVGDRLIGFCLAGAVSTAACMLVWPPPWHEQLRLRLASAARALAGLIDAHAQGRRDPDAYGRATDEVTALRESFESSPYPPTSVSRSGSALARLVSQLEWVAHNAFLSEDEAASSFGVPEIDSAHRATAATLTAIAELVSDHEGRPVTDPRAAVEVRNAAATLDQVMHVALTATITEASAGVTGARAAGGGGADALRGTRLLSAVDPTFRARALTNATELAARTALESAGAGDGGSEGGLWQRWRRVASALAAHGNPHSVWFRNAVRGGVALAVAVGLVEVTAVKHGFWVILGTLSVLRSSALGTGSNALRAVGGTAVGFVIGSAILLGSGTHQVALWALLPLAVFLAGVAPVMISFAASQAAFTVMVVILFNIIKPTGWTIGLVRIEDVTLGCAVSVVVGVLMWPRGATAELGRALGDAYAAASAYLSAAAARLAATGRDVDLGDEQRRTALAFNRLDDALRQFATERGAKTVPPATVSELFGGAVTLRMAAHSLARLPTIGAPAQARKLEPVDRANRHLRQAFESLRIWYGGAKDSLTGAGAPLGPPPRHETDVHRELLAALAVAQQARRPDQVRATLRMLWADQALDELAPIEDELVGAAGVFAPRRARMRRAGGPI